MKKIIITILTLVFLCPIYACEGLNIEALTKSESDSSITEDNPITDGSSATEDNSATEDSSVNNEAFYEEYNGILEYYNTEIQNQYNLAISYAFIRYFGTEDQYSAELALINNEEQSAYIQYEKQKKAYYSQYLSYGYSSAAARSRAEQDASANYNKTMSAISAKKLELTTKWENTLKYNECIKKMQELELERDKAIQELLDRYNYALVPKSDL